MGEKAEAGSDQALQPAPAAPKPCNQNAAGRLPSHHLHQVRCHDCSAHMASVHIACHYRCSTVSCEAGIECRGIGDVTNITEGRWSCTQ